MLPASGAAAAIQAGGTRAPGEAEGYEFKPLSVSCNPFSGPEERQPLQLPGHAFRKGQPKAARESGQKYSAYLGAVGTLLTRLESGLLNRKKPTQPETRG